jgi:lipopolysaccharide export system protein LptC
MNDRISAWFPLVLLGLLAAVSFWLNQQVQPPGRSQGGNQRHDPDYVVEDISASRYGEDGRRRYTLSAARVTHYPDDDTTHLEAPRLTQFSRPGAPVTVTARTALVSSNGENVYLHDDVKVVRAPYGKRSRLTLETNYLHVIPDRDFAQTDQPVTIYDADTVINAIGLEFNNATRVLKFMSNVRGSYANPPRAR